MVTLQQNSLHFNSQIQLCDDGDKLSGDGGLALLCAFEQKINFKALLNQKLHLIDTRAYASFSYTDCLLQVIHQLVLGYSTDSVANQLQHNLILEKLTGQAFVSQPSLSRFWNLWDEKTLQQLCQINLELVKQVYLQTKPESIILDMDTTHFDTFGKQEKANYNSHYETLGYQPKLLFDANGLFLAAQLHSGSTYSSKDMVTFLKPVIQMLQTLPFVKHIILRGDSGFASPEIYDFCEEEGLYYLIRLKQNAVLKQFPLDWQQIEQKIQRTGLDVYTSISYQAKSWRQARRVAVFATYETEPLCDDFVISQSLFLQQTFLVTNLPHSFSSHGLLELYRLRGNMENFIKESKSGFFMGKTDSSRFVVNEARMMTSVLAYNLIVLMKQLILPQAFRSYQMTRLRERLFKVAVRMTSHAKKIILHYDSTFAYKQGLWAAFQVVLA